MDPSISQNITHLSTEEIIETVQNMQQQLRSPQCQRLRMTQKWDELSRLMLTDFQLLHYAYPSLFRMIIERGPQFDINQLIGMLQLRERMRSGEVREEDAHTTVGQAMVDRYVKPTLPPTTPEHE